MKSKGNPLWDWIGNPADISIGLGQFGPGDILQMMAKNQNFDLFIAIIGAPPMRGQQVNAVDRLLQRYKLKEITQKPILAVLADRSSGASENDIWRWKMMHEVCRQLIDANIPFYPTIERAATVARKLTDYYQNSKLRRFES